MESHGLPGAIQVTEATRRLLSGRYEFEDRGDIEVKAKGRRRAYSSWVGRSGFALSRDEDAVAGQDGASSRGGSAAVGEDPIRQQHA